MTVFIARRLIIVELTKVLASELFIKLLLVLFQASFIFFDASKVRLQVILKFDMLKFFIHDYFYPYYSYFCARPSLVFQDISYAQNWYCVDNVS